MLLETGRLSMHNRLKIFRSANLTCCLINKPEISRITPPLAAIAPEISSKSSSASQDCYLFNRRINTVKFWARISNYSHLMFVMINFRFSCAMLAQRSSCSCWACLVFVFNYLLRRIVLGLIHFYQLIWYDDPSLSWPDLVTCIVHCLRKRFCDTLRKFALRFRFVADK